MFMNLNWIDWVIIAVLVYYGFTGWEAGFVDLGVSFITFVASLWLAVKFHAPVGDFLTTKFGVPPTWTSVIGYVLVGFIAEIVLSEIASILMLQLPKKLVASKANKGLGVLISVFNGLVVVSFILLVLMALPLRGTVKQDVKNSVIGSWLVSASEKFGGPIESSIQEAKQVATQFMTIDPSSKESISLNITPTANDLQVDDADERGMLALVNQERAKAGVAPLTVDVRLIPVARDHSRDMFLRRYFSHITPDGLSPADRIERAGITFTVAGENIAYAPDMPTAHTGLMNSPGHRANILDPSFHHVGIGIINTDSWGMMVTQDFTN